MPTLPPSTLNCTPATPTLSAAVPESVTVPETAALFAGFVIETVGAVVSGAGPPRTVMDPFEAILPATLLPLASLKIDPVRVTGKLPAAAFAGMAMLKLTTIPDWTIV